MPVRLAPTFSIPSFTTTTIGTGSNLTISGTVECDASIMSSAEDFGAVGAISGVKNPIVSAYNVLVGSQQPDPHGRIPPMLLAGSSYPGSTIEASEMVTPRARSEWERWKAAIQLGQTPEGMPDDNTLQDTVGAVICTIDGDVSAGVSRS